MNDQDKPRIRNSAEWLEYYRANEVNRLPVPWESGAGVTDAERDAIVGSLRGWQLGETSDGRRLVGTAQLHAAATGDPEFVEVIGYFIREEQRHGADLGRFLELAGVKLARWDWGDALFRGVRYLLPRLEVWATPVVIVEVQAMVYYAAVGRASGSAVLRAICRQILLDEVPHIRFQCERLAQLHHRRSRVMYALTMAMHRVFFMAMTLAIWFGHAKALKAGGYTFPRYWRTVWSKMDAAWRMMKPRAYRWPAAEAVKPAPRVIRAAVSSG